jgi:hypothetical protein
MRQFFATVDSWFKVIIYFTAQNEYSIISVVDRQRFEADPDQDLALLFWCRSWSGSGASIFMSIWIWIRCFYIFWCRYVSISGSGSRSGASILMLIQIWIWRFYCDVDPYLDLALLFWCQSRSGFDASILMLIRIRIWSVNFMPIWFWIWYFWFDADPVLDLALLFWCWSDLFLCRSGSGSYPKTGQYVYVILINFNSS